MTTHHDNPEKKSWSWLKIALFVSLGINLLIVGFLVGAAARHMGDGPHSARNPGLGAFGAPYMLALGQDDRRDVFRHVRKSDGDDVPDRRERRAMFAAVISVLRAQPFDPAALEATVAKQAETTVLVQKRVQTAWLEVVSGMTDEERRVYADAVEAVLNKKRKRK